MGLTSENDGLASGTTAGEEGPPPRRIVSLLASITEILGALGCAEEVVGVTHCCDFPPAALEGALVVTTSDVRPALLSQEEIHEKVSGALRRGDSLYALDEAALTQLRPTHVFTQSLCDICAVSAPLVRSTCARIFPENAATSSSTNHNSQQRIVSLEPQSLTDVWETIRVAGRVLAVEDRADRLIASYEEDLRAIGDAVERHRGTDDEQPKPKPRVAFLEWHDPFVSGGHWIADMLEIAGGDYTLNRSGQPSACLSDEDLADYDPDVILIGPCGFDTDRAVKDTLPLLHSRPCWKNLRAVRSDRVFALDGNRFFARPGPRLVQGTGLMAECLWPGIDLPERLAPPDGCRRITRDLYHPPPAAAT